MLLDFQNYTKIFELTVLPQEASLEAFTMGLFHQYLKTTTTTTTKNDAQEGN